MGFRFLYLLGVALTSLLALCYAGEIRAEKRQKENYQRTVVFLEKKTIPGNNVFFRGGIDQTRRKGCTNTAETSACAIPIRSRSLGSDINFFGAYNAWRKGDFFLDWYGMEAGQGSYIWLQPEGTPAVWTTNSWTHPMYNSLNKYGPHFWMVDLDMDCSRTDNGFFELKAFQAGVWEPDIQSQPCHGSGATGTPNFNSTSHVAACGKLNVFRYNQPVCLIEIL